MVLACTHTTDELGSSKTSICILIAVKIFLRVRERVRKNVRKKARAHTAARGWRVWEC